MGYDMNLMVFKKRSLERIKEHTSVDVLDFNITDAYSIYLFTLLHSDDYVIPEGEEARYILSESYRILDDFFKEKGVKVENDEAILISKKTYEDLVIWVEEKLKSTTLFDLAWKDEFEILTYVTVYQNLKREKIDFDTEFVLFIHDW